MGGKLQYLEIKNFMRWVATLKRSEPMIFTDIEELRRTVPAEYDFFTQYGVRSLIAVPFSKRLNQGYIGVDNPKRYGADPAFLFIIAYAVAQELNEIKLNKSLAAAKQLMGSRYMAARERCPKRISFLPAAIRCCRILR